MIAKKIIKNLIPWLEQDKKIYKLYIKSHRYYLKKNKILSQFYWYKIYKKYNCIISPASNIGKNLILPHALNIIIGDGAVIENNVTIYQDVTIGQKKGQYPKIGSNVIIFAGAKIIGNVKIGNNSVVGANAVVIKDVPDNATVAGIPAKVIKNHNI